MRIYADEPVDIAPLGSSSTLYTVRFESGRLVVITARELQRVQCVYDAYVGKYRDPVAYVDGEKWPAFLAAFGVRAEAST